MRITREEYRIYLLEQRRRVISTLLHKETREFIKAHESDIRKAFTGTNIKSIEL